MSTINRARPTAVVTQPKQAVTDLFNNAVALKRGGNVDAAIKLLDQALQTQPNYLAGQLARAGYQAVAGDAEGAQKMFDAIAVPDAADGKTFNEAGYLYHLNATWFHGVMGNDKAAIGSAKKVLDQAPNGLTREPLAKFFAAEPDLAHLRNNPEVIALLKPPGAAANFEANANAFETGASADFAAGASADKPAAGNSPLNTRLAAAAPAKPALSPEALAALDDMAAVVSADNTVGSSPLDRLATLINDSLQAAQIAGEDSMSFDTNVLDKLLSGGYKDYEALGKVFESMGAKAFADGFTGVSVSWDNTPPAENKDTVMMALSSSVKPPQKDASPGAQLGALLNASIATSIAEGDSYAKLSTSDLDRLVRPLKLSYGDVSDKLKELGFKSNADGFTGVGVLWEESDKAGVDAADLGKLTGLIQPPQAMGPSDRLVAMLSKVVTDAVNNSDTQATLETNDISPILKEIGADLEDVAKALEKAGFDTDYDGFIGVFFGWDK